MFIQFLFYKHLHCTHYASGAVLSIFTNIYKNLSVIQPQEVHATIISILWWENWERLHAQGHRDAKWHSKDSNTGGSVSKTHAWNHDTVVPLFSSVTFP